MKKKLWTMILLALIGCMFFAVSVNAEEVASGTCGSDLTWTLDDSGKLTISGSGAMDDWRSVNFPWYSKKALITSVVIEENVTTVGNYAFYNCDNMTDIDLPDSIVSIGENALCACYKLTEINIPKNVASIGEDAFGFCSALTTISIPGSVTSIGEGAFGYCPRLTGISVADGNTEYCDIDGVLFNKEKTKLICYPKNKSGSSYTVPDGVTAIENSAFYACSNLSCITIPGSVAVIGEEVFDGCTKLTEISVGDDNARYCDVDGVLFNKDKTELICYPAEKSDTSYTVPDGVEVIGNYAFADSKNLTQISIPDTVETIGDHVFDSSGLNKINIPVGVTTIGNCAFYYCSKLPEINIPDSVVTIGNDAFYHCNALTIVTLPASMESIGNYAFEYCSELTTVIFENNNTTIGRSAFSGCSKLTVYGYPDSTAESYSKSQNIPFAVLDTESVSGTCGSNLTWELVYGTLTISGTGAMTNWDDHTQVPWYEYTDSIFRVVIEDGVSSIGKNAFCGCTKLNSVDVLDGVKSIGSDAFRDCAKLMEISIAESVRSIGKDAFSGCTALTIGGFIGSAAESYAKTNDIPFRVMDAEEYFYSGTCGDNVSWRLGKDGTLIIFGTGNMRDYSSLQSVPWYFYMDDIKCVKIEHNITFIGDFAFSGCNLITNITIPDSVISIGSSVFSGCTALTDINFSDRIVSIDDVAFKGCTSLTNITIPDSVISIGSEVFSGCTALNNIIIPDSVESIGDSVFEKCPDSLIINGYVGSTAEIYAKEWYLPFKALDSDRTYLYSGKAGGSSTWTLDGDGTLIISGTGNIGSSITYDLSKVKIPIDTLIIEQGITSIYRSAFESCTDLKEIFISDTVDQIDRGSFLTCTKLEFINVDKNNLYFSNDSYGVLYNKDKTTLEHFPAGNGLTEYKIPASVSEIWDLNHHMYSPYYDRIEFGDTLEFIDVDEDNENFSCDQYGVLYNKEKTRLLLYPRLNTREEYTVPDGVRFIGTSAFLNCVNLTAIELPDGVTFIGTYAFENCENLTNINLPDSIDYICDYAFGECDSLTKVDLPDNITSIEDGTFYHCKNLTTVDIPDSVTSVGPYVFQGCDSLTKVDLPDTITSILDGTYLGCDSLITVDIPDSVTYIGYGAFAECPNLTTVNFPNSVKYIDWGAFADCPNLTTVNLSNSVTVIDELAFNNCAKLTTINIPRSVTSIKRAAFAGCEALTGVYFEGDAPSIPQEPFPDNTILYYIPGRSGWTDSEAYDAQKGTWHGYKLVPFKPSGADFLTEWDTSAVTLKKDETYSFSGEILAYESLAEVHVFIADADNPSVGIDYYLSKPEGVYLFDLSQIPAIKAGGILSGLQLTNNQPSLSLSGGSYLIRLKAVDAKGNTSDLLSKMITVESTLNPNAPVVEMLPITEITADSAKLQAKVVDAKGGIIRDFGFNMYHTETGGERFAQYSASNGNSYYKTAKYDQETGIITVVLKDYNPNMTYYAEGFAVYYQGETPITGFTPERTGFTTAAAQMSITSPTAHAVLPSSTLSVAGNIDCKFDELSFENLVLTIYDSQMNEVVSANAAIGSDLKFTSSIDLAEFYAGSYTIIASVDVSDDSRITSAPVSFNIPGKLTVLTDPVNESDITAVGAAVTGRVPDTMGKALTYFGFKVYDANGIYLRMYLNDETENVNFDTATGTISGVIPASPGQTLYYEAFVCYETDGVMIECISKERKSFTAKTVDIALDRINNYTKDNYMLDDTASHLDLYGHLSNIADGHTFDAPQLVVTNSAGTVVDTQSAVMNGNDFSAQFDMSAYQPGVYTITASVKDETGRVSSSNIKKVTMPQKANQIVFKTHLGGEELAQDVVHTIAHWNWLVVDIDFDTTRSSIEKIEWITSDSAGLALVPWNESDKTFDKVRPQTCQFNASKIGTYTVTVKIHNYDGTVIEASLQVEVRAVAILCFVDYMTQEPMAGVNVQITSQAKAPYSVNVTTDEYGQIMLYDLPYSKYTIKASANGYNDLEISYTFGDGSNPVIMMYDDDHVVYNTSMTAIYYKDGTPVTSHSGADILNTSATLDADKDYTVSIKVKANESRAISCYQLVQKGKVIGESVNGSAPIVLNSLESCKKNEPVYIRVCYTDGSSKDELTQLRFTKAILSDAIGAVGNLSLNLGDEISITLPESVPLFGGQEIKLDLFDIPASFKVDDNKMYVIVGAEDIFKDKSGKGDDADYVVEMNSDYKYGFDKDVRNAYILIKEAIKKSDNLSDAIDMLYCNFTYFSIDKMLETKNKAFGVDVIPVILGTFIYDNETHKGEFELVVQMKLEAEKDFQFFPGGVPIIVTIKLTGGVGMTLDIKDDEIVGTNSVEDFIEAAMETVYPTVEVGFKVGAGFGIADIATVTAEGDAEFDGKIKPSPEMNLDLGINIRLKLLVWEHVEELTGIKFKYENGNWYKKELDGDWEKIQENQSSGSGGGAWAMLRSYRTPFSQFSLADRSYLEYTTTWCEHNEAAVFAALRDNGYKTDVRTLMSYIYPDTQLQTVQSKDHKVMIWLTDDATRASANRTKLVYSVYNEILGTWSTPQSVADDGTLDSYPRLATDGNDIWAVWVNMNTALTDDMALDESMLHSEICAAWFDPQTMSFRKVTALTENEVLDLNPAMAVLGDRAAAAWVSNDSGDLWGTSGNNTIYVSVFEDGAWSEAEAVKVLDSAVTDLGIGFVNGTLCTAYCVDSDDMLDTIDDISVHLINTITGEEYLLDEDCFANNIQFAKINGEQMLTWYADGSIRYITSPGSDSKNLLGDTTVSPGYKLISDGNGTVILKTSAMDAYSELFVSVYDEIEDSWSNDIRLTYQNEAFINDFGAMIEENGDITVIYTSKIDDMAQMHAGRISFVKDLSLDSVTFNHSDAMPGQMTQLYVKITNHGIHDVESVAVQLKKDGEVFCESVVSAELAAGETKTVTVPVEVPDTDGVTAYSVELVLPGETEIDLANNIQTIEFGYGSTSLTMSDMFGENSRLLSFEVSNDGGYAVNPQIVLYKDNEAKTVIETLDFGKLEGKSKSIVHYTLTDLDESVYIELVSDRSEYYLGDNTVYYPLELSEETYTVTGSITSYGSADDPVTLRLLDENGVEVDSVQVTATEYTLTAPAAGTYTLEVSKNKHVTRTYTVSVGS